MNRRNIQVNDIELNALNHFFKDQPDVAAFYFAIWEISKTQGKWLEFYSGQQVVNEIISYHEIHGITLNLKTYYVPDWLNKCDILLQSNGLVLLDGFFDTMQRIIDSSRYE